MQTTQSFRYDNYKKTEATTFSDANIIYLYVNDFVDFPEFNGESNKYADFNNKIGFVVENIQQDNKRLKDIEEN